LSIAPECKSGMISWHFDISETACIISTVDVLIDCATVGNGKATVKVVGSRGLKNRAIVRNVNGDRKLKCKSFLTLYSSLNSPFTLILSQARF